MARRQTRKMDPKRRLNLYVRADEVEILERFRALEAKTNKGCSSIIMACMMACVDTLEKDLHKKKVITLNGKKVMM